MITCFLTNWGVTIALGLLLTASEWLAKTKRFEENGLLDLITHFLKVVLRKETFTFFININIKEFIGKETWALS